MDDYGGTKTDAGMLGAGIYFARDARFEELEFSQFWPTDQIVDIPPPPSHFHQKQRNTFYHSKILNVFGEFNLVKL